MKISNWDKWQTYRSDRSTPPWIKVHRNLMSNHEWVQLTDAEKGQLVSIWVLAADKKGVIPDCPNTIQKMCMLDKKPNLNKFIELGFLASDGCHDDVTVTHQTRLEADKIRLDKSKDTYVIPKGNNACPYEEIKKLYHEKLPNNPQVASLSSGRKAHIKARWKKDIPDLESWSRYFEYVGESLFLTGRVNQNNGRKPFLANIDFLIKESNVLKIVEGNYHE